MNGVIVNYRRGKRTMTGNQMVVEFEGIDSRAKASALMGKPVQWETPSKKRIVGTISRLHGNKGAVIVRFNKGLPGQSIGTSVEAVEPKK